VKVDKEGNLPPCKAGDITSIPSRVTACTDTSSILPRTYQSFTAHISKGAKNAFIKGNEDLRSRTADIRAEILVYIPGVSVFKY